MKGCSTKDKKKLVHLGACPRGNHDRAESPTVLGEA